MKKIIIFTMLLICVVSLNAQVDSIKIIPTENVYETTLNDVTFKVNLNPTVIYNRTISWVNKTYANPEKVLVGKVEAESVTISGYSKGACYTKSMGTNQYYDMNYHIYLIFKDSIINYKIVIDNMGYNGSKFIHGTSYWFKNNNAKKGMNVCIVSLEKTINDLLLSYYNSLQNAEITSDEAISELKKYKDKLDLELITQEEYDAKKLELSKYIK